MKPYTHIEPRTEVSDAALASGDLNAWRQILGFAPPRDPTGVPPGDLGDAIKPGNPTPSDFQDDADEIEDETDDDMYDDGDGDEDDD